MRTPPEYVIVPREDLAAIVNYLMPAEEADYENNGQPAGHAYEHLRVLDDALTAWLRHFTMDDVRRILDHAEVNADAYRVVRRAFTELAAER